MRTTGITPLALLCRDMEETVAFYAGVLGMPLYKTVALPDGGQHFFFDCGGGDSVAFFWWPDAPPAAPGIASVKRFPEEPRSAIGSMNHVAFNVPEEKLDEYRQRLVDAGVKVLPNMVVNHDDSPMGVSAENHPGVFFRSVYFTDPNGIMLELAATTKTFGPDDIRHEPARAVRVEA